MPSTYSPNLRIELIATGEQANTWGVTTNTNLGTLIEQAICGLVSVDVTAADVTLTALDGLSDQSRNMIIEVNGTAGTPRTIYIPAVSKIYVINNFSDDIVTMAVDGGLGIGFDIASGSQGFIYTDGTDVFSAAVPQSYVDGRMLPVLKRNGTTTDVPLVSV